MNTYTIYYHKSPENKYYIGQTCQDIQKRWRNGHGYKSIKFSSAIKKYGWDNFEHGILEENIPQDKVDEREAYYIKIFNSVENGYNTYKQNYSNYHFTDLWNDSNVREYIINILTEQRNTPEYHKKQSELMSKLWQTKEYREAQEKSWTDDRRKKLSEKSKSLWEDSEYREKISKAQSEYRKKDWENPEYRKKMCVQVRCIETNQIFESVKAAAEWCGVKSNTLSSALSSKTHQSGRHPESGIKLHWERVTDEVGKEG